MSEESLKSGLNIHEWAEIHDITSPQFRSSGQRSARDLRDGSGLAAQAEVLSIHEWANIHNIASTHYRACNLHEIREEMAGRKPKVEAQVETPEEAEARRERELAAELEAEIEAELEAGLDSPATPAADDY